MYLFFGILCMMLLAFNLELIPGRPWHGHYVLIWKWNEFTLVRIFPQNTYFLVDKDLIYRYEITSSKNTYIPAICLNTKVEREILHYRYLLEWIKEPPVLKSYPPDLSDQVEILNHVSKSLT